MATRSGPYQAWSNFTFISDQGHVREVDLLVAVPTGLYLIEIKNFRGWLTNHNATWVLHGEHSTRSFDNPLPLSDQKAKELKGLLTQAAAKERGDRPPFLRARWCSSAPPFVCSCRYLDRHANVSIATGDLRTVTPHRQHATITAQNDDRLDAVKG